MNSYFDYLPEELLYLTLSYSSSDDIKNLSKGLKLYIDYEELFRLSYPKTYYYSKQLKKINTVYLSFEWNNLYHTCLNLKHTDNILMYDQKHLYNLDDSKIDLASMNLLNCIEIYKEYPKILNYDWPISNLTYTFINTEVEFNIIQTTDFLTLDEDGFFEFLEDLGNFEQYIYIFMYISNMPQIGTSLKNTIEDRLYHTNKYNKVDPSDLIDFIPNSYITILMKIYKN